MAQRYAESGSWQVGQVHKGAAYDQSVAPGTPERIALAQRLDRTIRPGQFRSISPESVVPAAASSPFAFLGAQVTSFRRCSEAGQVMTVEIKGTNEYGTLCHRQIYGYGRYDQKAETARAASAPGCRGWPPSMGVLTTVALPTPAGMVT